MMFIRSPFRRSHRMKNQSTAGPGLLSRALILAGVLAAAACADAADAADTATSDFTSGLSYSPASSDAPANPPRPVADAEPRELMYVHGTLNVRAEPRKDAPVVRTLARGDQVHLGPADANGWARLYSPGSDEGYVYREGGQVSDRAPVAETRDVAPGYHLGPRGGCYTYTRSGNKRYVDRSYCR